MDQNNQQNLNYGSASNGTYHAYQPQKNNRLIFLVAIVIVVVVIGYFVLRAFGIIGAETLQCSYHAVIGDMDTTTTTTARFIGNKLSKIDATMDIPFDDTYTTSDINELKQDNTYADTFGELYPGSITTITDTGIHMEVSGNSEELYQAFSLEKGMSKNEFETICTDLHGTLQ